MCTGFKQKIRLLIHIRDDVIHIHVEMRRDNLQCIAGLGAIGHIAIRDWCRCSCGIATVDVGNGLGVAVGSGAIVAQAPNMIASINVNVIVLVKDFIVICWKT